MKLNILPLPEEGKPEDFYGVIGKTSLSVVADALTVEEGEPINLTFTLRDNHFPMTLDLPNLMKQTAFKNNFSAPKREGFGEVRAHTKVFSRTLRPLRTDVKQIPAIRIPYFDPLSKSYGIAQQEAIDITVLPAETITAFDAEISNGETLKNTIEASNEGIRHNLIYNVLKPDTLSRFWCFTLFFPPLVFLIFYFVTRDKRLELNDPVRARAKKSRSHYLRRGKVKNLEKLEDSVRKYFGDRLNLNPRAHTLIDLRKHLQDRISEAQIKELSHLYQSFDQQRFSPGTKNKLELQALQLTSDQLIASIHRRLKRG